MSPAAWSTFTLWLAAALVVAALLGVRAVRGGRGREVLRRLRSPTVYLFAAYLLVAALVTPLSPGESTSPLLWLALVLPIAYAASAFAAAGSPRAGALARAALAVLFGGAVIAAAALILAIVSPVFVPGWLR